MKRMRRAIRVITALLVASFLGLGGWLGYTVYSQGARWTTSQMNSRLSVAKKTNAMGDIVDRNGLVLATTHWRTGRASTVQRQSHPPRGVPDGGRRDGHVGHGRGDLPRGDALWAFPVRSSTAPGRC